MNEAGSKAGLLGSILLPLVLAQFICSYAGSIDILSRRVVDSEVQRTKPKLDTLGAILSEVGLFFLVVGILASGTYGWFTSTQDFSIDNIVIIPEGSISPVWLLVAIGAVILLLFFLHIRSKKRKGKSLLLSTHIFRNRRSNLGLLTQFVQWMVLQGALFVISVFLQAVRGFSAVSAGLIVTPATIGIVLTGTRARKMSKRFSQRMLIHYLDLVRRPDSGHPAFARPSRPIGREGS